MGTRQTTETIEFYHTPEARKFPKSESYENTINMYKVTRYFLRELHRSFLKSEIKVIDSCTALHCSLHRRRDSME